MIGSRCHVAVLIFLLCLINTNVKGASVVDVSEGKSSTVAPLIESSTAKTDAASSTVVSSTHLGKPTIKANDATSPTAKLNAVKGDVTVSPDITPSTVPSDPDNPSPPPNDTTSTSTTSTTSKPTTTPVTTVTTSKTTITPSPTTTKATTTASQKTTSVTTVTPSTSSTTNPVTTTSATTTAAPVPHHSRQFDGPSFIGGIVLASGLMAIGFVAFKFYKARTERNYHTL